MNIDELNKRVKLGLLATNETEDLILYNYTDKCTYEKAWDEFTINSRGTIYNKKTGNVVAMSFPKFFNFGELDDDLQKKILKETNFTVMEKVDGSLGNLFYYNNKWQIATRGSFKSKQALYATNTLLKKYNMDNANKNLCYQVEIIYPENKIIVDYGDDEKLVLLSAHYPNGDELSIDEIQKESLSLRMEIPKIYNYTFDEILKLQDQLSANEEGFVIRLQNNYRVKFKSVEYLRIARLLSRKSSLSLWATMFLGKCAEQMLEDIPEEFRKDFDDIVSKLETAYIKEMGRVRFIYKSTYNESLPIKEQINLWKPYKKDLGLLIEMRKLDKSGFDPNVTRKLKKIFNDNYRDFLLKDKNDITSFKQTTPVEFRMRMFKKLNTLNETGVRHLLAIQKMISDRIKPKNNIL